ncbi:MAG: J domain-containing protein [Mesorhizobium sp.]|nr:MAG: J domain-containing protein [Mesorhizobium sp.]
MRDPYEVLGVARNASAKDIKSAYRKLAKKHHPDQNPNDPKAKDRFAAANQAYEIVGDEKTRAAYDRGEIDADGKPKFQGFEGAAGGGDPFAGFRRQQGPGGAHFEFRSGRPGGDPFDVTIEEAATAEKVTAMFPDGRKVAVKLPAYVEDGQTIRLKGQGEQGPGQPGDALVKIHFRRHPRYRVEGRDLHADLPVALADAVLGAKVAVETPTGRLAVNVPAWSSSDKVLRLKGRGLPEKTGGHGDLYVHVRLMLPEGGDSELEALMRRQNG